MWGLAQSTGIWGIPRNDAVAILNFYFAALGGDIPATMSLANRHLNGIGVPKSCETALLYYQVAAEKSVELREAEAVTPILYDEQPRRLSRLAEKVRANYPKNDEVVDYYHYSAEKGDSNAMLSLAMLYYFGARGVEQNLIRAAHYFHRAFDLGAQAAGANLGHIYANGMGVEQDVEAAFKYFQEAAHEGSPAAQNGMGYM